MSTIDEILNDNDNVITLDTLSKYISKPMLTICYRFADVDGLGNQLSLIENFDTLENSLKKKHFEIINIDYKNDCISVGYYAGYRDHEEIHNYYNLGKKNLKKFKGIVEKYKHNVTNILDLTK